MNARLRAGSRALPQAKGQMFVTDGGIATHMIFNEGEPHDGCVLSPGANSAVPARSIGGAVGAPIPSFIGN